VADRCEIKQCEDWTYRYHGPFTLIFDDSGSRVTEFYRKLTYDEVYAFRAGWGVGREAGRKLGRDERSEELRKLLGL
jgi:hypothetical protein